MHAGVDFIAHPAPLFLPRPSFFGPPHSQPTKQGTMCAANVKTDRGTKRLGAAVPCRIKAR